MCLGVSWQVTGSQTLKLVHDRFRGKPPAEVMQEMAEDMSAATRGNSEVLKHLGNAMDDLSSLRVSSTAAILTPFLKLLVFHCHE